MLKLNTPASLHANCSYKGTVRVVKRFFLCTYYSCHVGQLSRRRTRTGTTGLAIHPFKHHHHKQQLTLRLPKCFMLATTRSGKLTSLLTCAGNNLSVGHGRKSQNQKNHTARVLLEGSTGTGSTTLRSACGLLGKPSAADLGVAQNRVPVQIGHKFRAKTHLGQGRLLKTGHPRKMATWLRSSFWFPFKPTHQNGANLKNDGPRFTERPGSAGAASHAAPAGRQPAARPGECSDPILWMDKIQFAPPKKPWNDMMFPCQYQ